MQTIGIIGGSGLYHFPELSDAYETEQENKYGRVEGITLGKLAKKNIVFFPRHGKSHSVPPHKINYRAIIQAFDDLQVEGILALNAVGGIGADNAPGSFVIPDQIIDYTHGREHTFFDGTLEKIAHVDFTYPFDTQLSNALHSGLKMAANDFNLSFHRGATYACTQGPRLESAAEIKKLRNDHCDLVGMTMMPEAVLAREKNIKYASLCFVVNWAAGINEEVISMENIMALLNSSVPRIRKIFCNSISFL